MQQIIVGPEDANVAQGRWSGATFLSEGPTKHNYVARILVNICFAIPFTTDVSTL